MYSIVNTEFSRWLLDELEEKGWSQAELARSAGLSRGFISNLINDMRQPGADACVALAKAFKLPPEVVLRKAGILPEKPGSTNTRSEQALHLFDQLIEIDQVEIIEIMEMKIRRAELYAEAMELQRAIEALPGSAEKEILQLIDDYMEKHGYRRRSA